MCTTIFFSLISAIITNAYRICKIDNITKQIQKFGKIVEVNITFIVFIDVRLGKIVEFIISPEEGSS